MNGEKIEMETLKRQEVINVIEGKGAASRVPLCYDMWIYNNAFGNSDEKRAQWLEKYPCDIAYFDMRMPEVTAGHPDDPNFCWGIPGKSVDQEKGLDAQMLIENWEDSDWFFDTFPSSESPALLPPAFEKDDRYLLGRWWFCFFERLWSLRGMENALTDFYLYPEYIHKLFRKLTDFYMRNMERCKEVFDCDGFFVSDDIGTQTAPFFSVEIFREFFKPYYKEIFDKAHELGCHFWIHTCGNIKVFLPEFIEIGLDIIHPIQKNTMDEREIMEEFGGQICFLSGIDVQYLFAFGTPQEVREEVKYLKETFSRPDGRLMMTMGNGSTPDWKIENLEAMYEAALDIPAEK